jgi:hypothetical protein
MTAQILSFNRDIFREDISSFACKILEDIETWCKEKGRPLPVENIDELYDFIEDSLVEHFGDPEYRNYN